MFEPRRPLCRDLRDVTNEQPLVLRVPPNTPTIVAGPPTSCPASDPAPPMLVSQLDGADNVGFHPEQGPAAPGAELQDDPASVYVGNLEVLQQVSWRNNVLWVWGKSKCYYLKLAYNIKIVFWVNMTKVICNQNNIMK